MKCKFVVPWAAECKKYTDNQNGQCEFHQDRCYCGKLANHGCLFSSYAPCCEPVCSKHRRCKEHKNK